MIAQPTTLEQYLANYHESKAFGFQSDEFKAHKDALNAFKGAAPKTAKPSKPTTTKQGNGPVVVTKLSGSKPATPREMAPVVSRAQDSKASPMVEPTNVVLARILRDLASIVERG